MDQSFVLQIELNEPYTYCRGGRYSPLFVATHAHSGQPQVVYRGLDGADAGRYFTCTLWDWANRFRRVAPVAANAAAPAPAEPAARESPQQQEERVAGFVSASAHA